MRIEFKPFGRRVPACVCQVISCIFLLRTWFCQPPKANGYPLFCANRAKNANPPSKLRQTRQTRQSRQERQSLRQNGFLQTTKLRQSRQPLRQTRQSGIKRGGNIVPPLAE